MVAIRGPHLWWPAPSHGNCWKSIAAPSTTQFDILWQRHMMKWQSLSALRGLFVEIPHLATHWSFDKLLDNFDILIYFGLSWCILPSAVPLVYFLAGDSPCFTHFHVTSIWIITIFQWLSPLKWLRFAMTVILNHSEAIPIVALGPYGRVGFCQLHPASGLPLSRARGQHLLHNKGGMRFGVGLDDLEHLDLVFFFVCICFDLFELFDFFLEQWFGFEYLSLDPLNCLFGGISGDNMRGTEGNKDAVWNGHL